MSVSCRLFGYSILPSLAHLFSDLLLVTDPRGDSVLAYITLDRYSLVDRVSQTKYFRYLLFLIGSNQAVYLLFETKREAEDFY
jgi:hypothetical protein